MLSPLRVLQLTFGTHFLHVSVAINSRAVPTRYSYSKAVQWDIPATMNIRGGATFLDKDSRSMLKTKTVQYKSVLQLKNADLGRCY